MAQRTMRVNQFLSRLEHFWNTERYTDVTIECGHKNFKCHRLVLAATCEYFDAMFGSQFCESNANSIPLKGISAETFEQVLKFIYAGEVNIDSENVCALLQASDFLKLLDIEDLCIQFIKENGVSVRDTLDIFVFACTTKKQFLVDILSVHVANHFEICSKANSFLEIPFHELKIILIRFTCSSMRNEEVLLGAITRWIHHNREERLQYFSEFVRMIRFENISSTYIQFMFTKFFLEPHNTALTQTLKPIGYNDHSLLREGAISETKTSLHIFATQEENKFLKVYSINSEQICSVSNWIPRTNPAQSICNVALNNSYLYCLHYPGLPPEPEDLFIPEQKFCAYISLTIPTELRLKSPPVNFEGTFPSLCAIENNIYACQGNCNIVHQINSSNLFNEEEINRGIYVYNCEIDNWFPVPKMKRQMEVTGITAENNILYLIGALPPDVCAEEYSQIYDCRTGIWQELPKTYYRYALQETVCCSMRGKVYVLGESTSPSSSHIQIERYDPVAGKWEGLTRSLYLLIRGMPLFCRVIPFLDKLWFIGKDIIWSDKERTEVLSIDVFDVDSCTWSRSPILDNICNSFGSDEIEDVVIFKSK